MGGNPLKIKKHRQALLVDGDLLIFQATSGVEEAIEFADDLTVLVSNPTKALAKFENRMEEIREALEYDEKQDTTVLCFSCPTRHYFRHDVLPTYKGNRVGGRKPLAFRAVVEQASLVYKTYTRDHLEGDDVMGILSTHDAIIPADRRVIVSGDKDMKQIPGLLYHTGESKLLEISEDAAEHTFWMQVITGDATDGYSGCPGAGPVRAQNILMEPAMKQISPWPAIVAAYVKAGSNEHVAIQMARVARILQASDYNFNTKEPILWNPPAATS